MAIRWNDDEGRYEERDEFIPLPKRLAAPPPEGSSVQKALQWALEMMEMYEGRLIEFGDPPELVRSAVHEQTRANAKRLATTPPVPPVGESEAVRAAAERLLHDFHEDEPSPLLQNGETEEEDRLRNDVLTLADAYLALRTSAGVREGGVVVPVETLRTIAAMLQEGSRHLAEYGRTVTANLMYAESKALRSLLTPEGA